MAFEIRLARSDDAGAIAEIYRPIVDSSPISFEMEPPDETEMRRRIEQTWPVYPWLVCEQRGHIAGYAYASKHRERAAYRWSVDVSAYVHPDFRRRGIGRGLYVSLIQILAAQGYANAYAGITLPNPGSVGVHESVGFRPIGVYRHVGFKLGAWHDVGWWQLPLQRAAVQPPRPPLSLAEVRGDPAWPSMLAEGLSCIRD